MPSAMPRSGQLLAIPPAVVAAIGVHCLLVALDEVQKRHFVRDVAGGEHRPAHQARALVDRKVHLVAEQRLLRHGVPAGIRIAAVRRPACPYAVAGIRRDQAASISVPALTISPLGVELAVELGEQRARPGRAGQLAAKARQGRVIGHRIGQREADEAAEREPVRQRSPRGPGRTARTTAASSRHLSKSTGPYDGRPTGAAYTSPSSRSNAAQSTSAAIFSSCRLRPAPPSTSPSARLSCPSSRRIHTSATVDRLIASQTNGYAKLSMPRFRPRSFGSR